MACAGDEQQSAVDLYIHAIRQGIGKVLLLPVAQGEGGCSAASLGFWDFADSGRHAMLLACPQAEMSPRAVGFHAAQLPGCSLSGAEHTLGRLSPAEPQWSLPPPLGAALVAA